MWRRFKALALRELYLSHLPRDFRDISCIHYEMQNGLGSFSNFRMAAVWSLKN